MKTRMVLNIVIGGSLLTAFFTPFSLADKVYTWKDSEGTVHYSEQPPASGQAERIRIKTTPPSAKVPAVKQPTTNDDKNTEQEPVVVPTKEPSTLTAAQKSENCRKARKNLAALETRPRVLTTDPTTGEKRVLNHDEHANLIIKSREHIRKYCNS